MIFLENLKGDVKDEKLTAAQLCTTFTHFLPLQYLCWCLFSKVYFKKEAREWKVRMREERDDDDDVLRHTLEIYAQSQRDFGWVFIAALRTQGDDFIKAMSSTWPFKGNQTGSEQD